MEQTGFAGRTVIVTGATRGIGRAVAAAFLQQGARVLGLFAGNVEAARAMEQEESAGELHLFQVDVADFEAVESLFVEIEQRFGRVDILVNNAGIRRDAVVAMMSQEDWERVIAVNLSGGFNMARFAVPLMLREKFGRIIFITSPMAHLGFPGLANYAASKAGQIGMMHSLAKETARKGITVNCVSPGFIETSLLEDLSADQLKAYRRQVPMRRFGTPEEVARAVLFLASSQASYITGAVLPVTGGI